jgi:hypothetical protein
MGALALAGGGGCVGPLRNAWRENGEELTVTGDEPTLAPGDESTLHVEANPVQSLQILPERPAGLRADGTTEAVELDVLNTTLEPGPSGGEDSLPPTWLWGPPTRVSAEVPVFVSDSADTGEYPYVVEVTGGGAHSEEEAKTVEFTITVTAAEHEDKLVFP